MRQITPLEREILALIRDGYSNKQISPQLNMREQTAKNHVSKILLKLGVANRTEAVVKAIRLIK